MKVERIQIIDKCSKYTVQVYTDSCMGDKGMMRDGDGGWEMGDGSIIPGIILS